MSIFASKAAFMQLGLVLIAPSKALMYQDCYICKDPLHVNIDTVPSDAHHTAVRIGVCGHIHGQVCLAAWLNTGNSCPTCKRMLFEASGRTISQKDLNDVVRAVGPLFGKMRVASAVARLLERKELEQTQLRRSYEEDLNRRMAEQIQSRRDDLMDDEYWMESGDEEDFDMDDDEEGGVPLLGDDMQPGSMSA
ncbi:hypothetical protein C7974DRAFT_168430 [Boeremia exigua]|uniref:uncharacterized protein n=1 Tax=Boeremia exigua TaxID=749465 RepID=UPI001E8D85D5|nr:uncharacterized protein C7974DRAFT_168430 [Boeremia exigua]KAH6633263.1 hypothetical protein C7974DRAFT_168430 [Boeremia exigua]